MPDIVKQWPNNIISGEIRYEKASNYDGFYLADAEHGIPTFGSVTATASPTIRDQHVRVFNYPGQTEAIASELVFRWNMHRELLSALKEARRMLWEMGCSENDFQPIRAAIVKAAAHAEQATPTETIGGDHER